MQRIRPCDNRTSYVSCLHLPLTVCTGRETINNILPDDVLLLIFYFDGPGNVDQAWRPSWHRLSSRVPEMAIPRFCIAKLSRLETRLRPQDKREAYKCLATLAHSHKGRKYFDQA